VFINSLGERDGVAFELGGISIRPARNSMEIAQFSAIGGSGWPRKVTKFDGMLVVPAGLNILNIHIKICWALRVKPLNQARPGAIIKCVIFTQHSFEKRPSTLWVGLFFVAPVPSFANV
jgi:hypothetical protein